jgi:hypothetical protein
LNPVLKLFFNPNPLIQALHIQSEINARYLQREELYYEVMHNLVVEITRLGIEVKNAKMRVESISSRLDFSERRARALETVVQYRPEVTSPKQAPREPPGAEAPRQAATREAPADAQMAFSQPGQGPGEGLRSRRRRRRRGRRAGSSGAPVTASSIPGPDAEVRLSPRQDTGPAAGGQLETSERPGAAPLQDRPPDIAIERPAPPSAEPPVPTPDRSGPIEQ